MLSYLSYANAPYWGFLPMGMTNFGGDTQIFTIPNYASPNIGLMLNPMGQAALTPSVGGGFNLPSFNPQSAVEYAKALVTPILNNMASSSINTSLQNISMTKTRLNAMLQQENITSAQRQKINELLEKLDEQEKKLKELTTSTNLDPQTAYNKAIEIEKEIRKIINEVSELVQNTSSTPGSSTPTTSTPGTSTPGTSTPGTSTPATSTPGTSTPSSVTPTNNIDNFSEENKAMADVFSDAVNDKWGTDNEKFNLVCSNINKNNVLEVMLAWNKYHSGDDNESFMEAFMWDADSTQKKEYGKLIANALRDRAEELGVYDECKEEFAQINKELNSFFYISNDISAQFDSIIEKMAKKAGSKYGTAQKS